MSKPNFMHLFCLTIMFFGIQFLWTVEFSAGNPYLLSLGMSKSSTPFVWAAGPIAGLLVQPVVGYYSDRSTLKFGRRKPFLLAGMLLVTVSLFLIAYAPMSTDYSIYFAVSGFYGLDFSINILMASARSLLVDSLHSDDQILGNAFAGRMVNAGDLAGYFIGALDLSLYFPGSNQMRILCCIGLLVLWSSMLITLIFIHEEQVARFNVQTSTSSSVLAPFLSILKSFRSLPSSIQNVCDVQIFNWMAWFPFLFYSSTWLLEVSRIRKSKASLGVTLPETSQIGSQGLFYFSLASFLSSLILPYIQHRFSIGIAKLWSMSMFFFATAIMLTMFYPKSNSAILFTVAVMGIPWFLTGWVPFSLIGIELAKYSSRSPISSSEDGTFQAADEEEGAEHSYTSLDSVYTLDSNSLEPGVVMGIHNMYICLPQLLSTLVTSLVFYVFGDGDESIGWTIRIASVFVLVGAVKAWRLQ